MTNEIFLQNEVYGISPTECFLRYLTYPEDYNVPGIPLYEKLLKITMCPT